MSEPYTRAAMVSVPAELVEALREAMHKHPGPHHGEAITDIFCAAWDVVNAPVAAFVDTAERPTAGEGEAYWRKRAESAESILTNFDALADDWRDYFRRGDYSDFLSYGAAADTVMHLLAGHPHKGDTPAPLSPSVRRTRVEAERAIAEVLAGHMFIPRTMRQTSTALCICGHEPREIHYPTDAADYRAHVASLLADLMADGLADAWDEGWIEFETNAAFDWVNSSLAENPYRHTPDTEGETDE